MFTTCLFTLYRHQTDHLFHGSLSLPSFHSPHPRNMDENIKISPKNISTKLSKLKISKSPGPDGIHPRVFHEARDELALPLSILYNLSLQTGTLPGDWKEAHIPPIYKKGGKKDPGNYRPISLTAVGCKVLESIIRDTIMDYMNQYNLFSKHQHGFINGRSCVTQLLACLDAWTDIIDKGGCVDVI